VLQFIRSRFIGILLFILLMSLAACNLPGQTPGGSPSRGSAQGNQQTGSTSTPVSPLAPKPTAIPSPTPTPAPKTTVFMILMENHSWSQIQGSPDAPYINNTLLPMASYAQQYYNPPNNHPSEPNYLWLEAGTNFGIDNDDLPANNDQSTTMHLVTLLKQANISWKSYQENITGKTCPLTNRGLYAPKHNPMVFFDDVTDSNDSNSAYCIAHIRPYSELSGDLQSQNVARYNFITPNLCNDMHNSCDPVNNTTQQGDTWLSQQIPMIMASQAYKNGGVIFITWDDGPTGDGPLGMLVLSPYAKGHGYSNSIHYTHSSTLRTVEEIFGVSPMLGDAANATDLSDLFRTFPKKS